MEQEKAKEKVKTIAIYQLFRFATKKDLFLMSIGALSSIGLGALHPGSVLIFGRLLGNMEMLDASHIVATAHPLVLGLVVLGTCALVLAYVSNCVWVSCGERQARKIRLAFVHSILHQDMAWFDQAGEGSLTTRLVADTQRIQDGMSEKFGLLLTAIAQFVTGIVIAFVTSWRLSVIMLATVPVLALFGSVMLMLITRHTVRAQDAYADAGGLAEQVFSGIRTVYAFQLQARFADKYEKVLSKAWRAGVKRAIVTGSGYGGFMFILFATYALAFWYGARLVHDGVIRGPTVFVVFMAMVMGAMAVLNVPPNLSAVASAKATATKIFATIDRKPEIAHDDTLPPPPLPSKGDIDFRHIAFAYPTRPDVPILHDFSLRIRPGMTVALVGTSGSGKSTVFQLLQRFYDPARGNIRLDGVHLHQWPLHLLRHQIGIVSQEPVLFNMTIRENLCLGTTWPTSAIASSSEKEEGDKNRTQLDFSHVTDDQLIHACKQCHCHEFISKLPDGYDTMIQSSMLSGGQKQRIAIARAILKNPPILLLDEATSALDTQSERLVQKALEAASDNRTTLVIAHRLSTIRNADMIVVMDKGRVVEQGTHHSLLQSNGVYASLVAKQSISTKRKTTNTNSPQTEMIPARPVQPRQRQRQRPQRNATVPIPRRSLHDRGTDPMEIDVDDDNDENDDANDANDEVSAPNLHTMLRVLRTMRPEWPLLAGGCLCASISGTIFPLYALLFGSVTASVLGPDFGQKTYGPLEGPNYYAFLFVMLGIAAFIGFFGQTFFFEVAGERYTQRLRHQLFAQYLKQEVGYFDHEDNKVGAVTSRLAVDAQNVNEMITKVWGDLVQLSVTACTGFIIAFIFTWKLTLIVMSMLPLMILSGAYESIIQKRFEEMSRKANEHSGHVAGEAIHEIRTVAMLNRQAYFEAKYSEATRKSHGKALLKAYLASIGFALNNAVGLYTNSVAFYAGSRMIANYEVDIQSMLVAIMSFLITSQNIGRTSIFTTAFVRAKHSALQVFALMDRQSLIDPDAEGCEPATVDGKIDFKNVDFHYPARPDVPIFRGQFNLHVPSGKTIALVGASGCGKSTTIGLLERWYDPVSGSVSVDNHNAKSFSLGNLRSHMALVGQEPVLFDMSIEENIRFGVPDDTDIKEEDLVRVCKLANIHDFVHSLPEGYKTRVGDKGSQLSGGQKQRIAIARALIRQPKILLLDEATSALDSESETHVQKAIDDILRLGDRSTISVALIIAHRLSSIQNADIIFVLDNGRVIEQGDHYTLLEQDGVYANLVRQQSLNVDT
ncbi:putative ABC transporter protein [Gongronella butleri]|nr:putative ABC transporter protein [Gongronella butleri]